MMKPNLFQDFFVLSGIIILSSILIIGLFPGRFDAGLVDENFFITTVMTVPVISAIYFIITSFRRRLDIKSPDIRESLSKKLTISFLFIAVLSTMPIVIVSSTYFNQNIAMMFKGSTEVSIREAIKLTDELYGEFIGELGNELESIKYYVGKFRRFNMHLSHDEVANTIGKKGFNLYVFKAGSKDVFFKHTLPGSNNAQDICRFYEQLEEDGISTDRIVIKGTNIICGAARVKDTVFALTREIPLQLISREDLFYRASDEYREVVRLRDYFVNGSGAFLMILSISIVCIAYLISLYLSKSITRPLVELSVASEEISKGNYGAEVRRRTRDEIGQLVESFNRMSRELKQNRNIMYQKQKLEAWNDMAKKLVHEIKNPLTPIRLSAERMRRLAINKSENMEKSIIDGAETIMSEADSLLKLVGEFNDFARLPEKHEENHDLYKLVKDTASLFAAYDNLKIDVYTDSDEKFLMFDRVLIKQALNNIIYNAVQAMDGMGSIEIRAEQCQEGVVQISIRDDGPGIGEDDLDKIFEPGFTLKKDGSGIGLAIVRKIVLEHFGKIKCKSIKGEGAEFIIQLPIDPENENGKNINS